MSPRGLLRQRRIALPLVPLPLLRPNHRLPHLRTLGGAEQHPRLLRRARAVALLVRRDADPRDRNVSVAQHDGEWT